MKILKKSKTQQLFWILAGGLPFTLFAAVMLFMFTQQQERAVSRLLHEIASNSADALDRAIVEQLGILKGLAISRSLDTGDLEGFSQVAERLQEMHPEWHTVIITNEHEQIFNLQAPSTQPLPPLRDRASLRKVWETKNPCVENLANGDVAIRVPVIRNERVIYTLAVTIDPQFYFNTVLTSNKTERWGFIIAGTDNVVIAASPDSPVIFGMSLSEHFLKKDLQIFSVGEMLYAAPIRISSGDWKIFVFAPEAFIQAPFFKKRMIVYLGGFLAAILTATLIYSMSSAWAAERETINLRREIEERKQTAELLRESEQRFRLVVENAPEAIFVQTEGQFAYLNKKAAQLFGAQSVKDLVGESIATRFHPDSHEVVCKRVQQLNEEKRALLHQDLICLGKEDAPVHIETSAVPFEYGGKNGALVFARDMTETLKSQAHQKSLETQLHQAQKMESIGRLAGGVAHDYSNMLSVIIGYTQLALKELNPEEKIVDYLNQVQDAANRSTDITRQLLAFARKQTIVPVAVNLNEAVDTMLKMLRRLIGEDIDLAWLPKKDLWTVKMDPTQVDQILANLCVNARDAINGVGRITIETDNASFDEAYCADHSGFTPGEYARLAVSDDGC